MHYKYNNSHTYNIYMTFSKKSIEKFIDEYVLQYDDIDEILNKCDTQSEKGFIYERLWDLVIKFGFCPLFQNNKYHHLVGNSNLGKMKKLVDIKSYIQDNNVISGNGGGCSDITLQNKETNEYIFITSKYPKSDEDKKSSKSVDYYDVQKIISMRDDNKKIYENYDIYTLVPNKEKLLKKVKKSNNSSKHMTKYLVEDKILDKNDLNKYFVQLKKALKSHNINSYGELYGNEKEKLSFPFHQRLIEKRTSSLIAQGEKTILWGCKPRSGKTYMCGNLIIVQSELIKKYNVLIITPAPTETSPQFTDDLFKKYSEFDKFKITHLKASKDIDKLDFTDNNIIVVSKQLLQMYTNDKTIKKIKDLKLNLIVFDENHFGGTTDRSEDILKSYVSPSTVKLYMTATYNKPLQKWKIPLENQIFWDIEDERLCKTKNIDGLVEKHGDIVKSVCKELNEEGYTDDEILKEYEKYPELEILTTMFDSQRWEIIKNDIMDSKYGFSMDVLFSLAQKKKEKSDSKEKEKISFNYPKEVKKVLQFISGDKKETNFKEKDLSMFTRIKNMCNDKNSRLPFTQLWFLPVNGIDNISKCLKNAMMEDDILKNYNVLIVNSKSDELVDNIKEEINKREIEAKKDKKDGLIILAGNMLSLGITLPLCDIVIMMNDTLSSDKVMQMMYRSMTESKACDKKCGFVVDMKISRVLQTSISYNIHKKIHNTEDKIKFLIENHLINIDSDYLKGKNIDSNKIVSKLMDIWKSDPINNLNTLLRQIEDDIVEMENDDQKALNKYFTKSSLNDKVNVKVEFKDEEDEKQEIKDGKEITKSDENDSKDHKSDCSYDNDDEIPVEKISLTKDVLPFAIPLACALTLQDNNNDFIEMLNTIAKDPELLEVFNEQSFIWWNNKDIIELIKKLTLKYIEKNSNTFDIAILIKMELKNLIDKPKELLEFISERLKPKEKEKKEFGEVFTPMCLVNDMLDGLDKYYIKEHENSIFENKDIKWGDIVGSGMGNYSIGIYLRLMKGLESKIKDKNKRRKHIIENMLYFCEMNKKNVHICKQIFDAKNEFKLNIYNGDGLKLNIKEKWGFDGFDVIIGNPPYQEQTEGKRKGGYGGKALWEKFVYHTLEKNLKKDGYMVFVHPSNWRKPEHELWDTMMSKQILYLEIHGESEGIKMFHASTRYDWYVMQNKKYTKNTDIIDEQKEKHNLDLRKWKFLPNYKLEVMKDMIVDNIDNGIDVMYSRSLYGTDKKNVKMKKIDDFEYQVMHNMTQNGYGFVYTNDKTKGHFGESKVILSFGRHQYPYNDFDGKYGMSQIVYGIPINSKKEGDDMIDAINSDEFREIIKATKWNTFYTEWRMFKYFKPDFYKKFLKDEKNTLTKVIKDNSDDDKSKKKKKVVKDDSDNDKTKKKEKAKKTLKKIETELDSESDFSDSSSEDEKPKKKKITKKK